MSVPLSSFEQMCSESNLRVIHRTNLSPGVDALVTEGYRQGDDHMADNHWLVTWALTRDDNVLETQVIRIPSYVTMPSSGVPVATNRVDRVDIAMESALRWHRNSKQVGWA